MTISPARDKFSQLEQWLYSPASAGKPLDTVEKAVETNGRELLRCALQEHVQKRGDGDVGDAITAQAPEEPSHILDRKRLDTRTLLTLLGPVLIRRMGYYAEDQQAIHPLDEQMQLPRRCYSYELQRRVVKMAVLGPFDEAADIAFDTMGLRLPKRSIEEMLVDACFDFDDFYATRSLQRTGDDDPVVVAAIDCKGIPMVKTELVDQPVRRGRGQKAQKKKMATVAAVFTQQRFVRTPQQVIESLFRCANNADEKRHHEPRCHDKRVWASLIAGKDAFIADAVREVIRRNPRADKQVVAVTDGERALQIRITRYMKKIILILDLAHVLEKLWIAAHVFHVEGSPEAQQFVRDRAIVVLNGNVGQVVKGFRLMTKKRPIKGLKRKTILGVCEYLYRNRSRMKYNVYMQKGLPIASGAVEGACKNLIKDRMERSGMRWTKRMAEAMVKMRALYLSGDLDEYWKFHIEKEQARLYISKWKVLNIK